MLMTNALALRSLAPLAANAGALSNPDCVLSGFPEYATGPESLAADQQQALRRMAALIARSRAGFNPVVAAIVVGHADKALRKAVGERAAFEHDVSQRRATAAAERLVGELIAESHGAHYAKVFRTLAIGIGNARPRFANAANEVQMQQNRRVEITLLSCWTGLPSCGTH